MSNKDFNLDRIYSNLNESLTQNRRADVFLNTKNYNEIKRLLENQLTNLDSDELKKVLCVLFYSRPYPLQLDHLLINLLDKNLTPDLLNNLISVNTKVIIERSHALGTKVNKDLLLKFETILENCSLENYFWILHAIDLTGVPAIKLFKKALERRPKFYNLFNKYYWKSMQHLRMLEIKFAPILQKSSH